MFELITRLRAQPVAYRRRVAFFTALGITAVIIALWIISLLVSFGREDDVVLQQTPGPFETLGSQIRGSFSSFRGFLTERGE